jgi:hypothetical protein
MDCGFIVGEKVRNRDIKKLPQVTQLVGGMQGFETRVTTPSAT